MKKNPCLQNQNYSDLLRRSKELTFDTELIKLASKKLFSNLHVAFTCPIQNDACENCYISHQMRMEAKFNI